MKKDITELSTKYRVRYLLEEDVPEIYDLCSKNEMYYRFYPPFATEKSIRDDMKALPPGKDMSDKYFIGYYDQSRLVAVMDLIMGFPDEKTAFLGFFMTDASVQKTGVGSCIIEELGTFLRGEGISGIRLCWVIGNPQAEHFWKKNGFIETGDTHEFDNCTVKIAYKGL